MFEIFGIEKHAADFALELKTEPSAQFRVLSAPGPNLCSEHVHVPMTCIGTFIALDHRPVQKEMVT